MLTTTKIENTLTKSPYFLTRIQAIKATMLLLWLREKSKEEKKSWVEMTHFDRRYKYLFGTFPLFYSWGPFYRDHGCASISSSFKEVR